MPQAAKVEDPSAARLESAVLSHGEFERSKHFSGLNGLRAIGIAMVVGHHTNHVVSGWIATLQQNGRGVSLLFILSGFLICTRFLREKERDGTIALRTFFVRRALRLCPLYYTTLGVYVLLVLGLGLYSLESETLFRDKLAGYVFYFSNLSPNSGTGPFFVSWSLAASEQFYVLFAVLLCLVRRAGTMVALIGGALLLKFIVYSVAGNVDAGSILCRLVFSYQEPLLWGVLLAYALHHRKIYEVVARAFASGWTVVALGAMTLSWLLVHRLQEHTSWDAELVYAMMTLLVGGTAIRRATPALDGPVFKRIASISYGIFLLHMPIISAVRKIPGGEYPLISFVLSMVLVVAVASVTHRWLEEPMARFGMGWFKSRRGRDPRSVPTAVASGRLATG